MPVALKKLTWSDIEDMPETHSRTELVDGELVVTPVASLWHQEICARLGAALRTFVQSRGLGNLFDRPAHVILSEHVHYEPDLCFIAKGRVVDFDSPYFEGAPDLIVEVISESNRSHDTVVKYRDYERHGVGEYWLVDPRDKHIRVYVLEGGKYQLLGVYTAGENVRSRTLDGLQLDPGAVFRVEA